ncbi:protein GVQW3 [Trichonephila clavipes]|uniref:Protein GVQW3 n=1 Tax=Trichonephila clavipes TaxID=2585209 RepID=A0A8X6S8P5_TRICX|nr:protein GVQW3 [Trichonephila clavipes]
MEQRNFEQRCAIKFCVKLRESVSVTFEKLKKAYGEHSLSQAQVFRWHKSFLEGRKQVEDEHRSKMPSTSKTDENIERVNTLVRSDHRLTFRMLKNIQKSVRGMLKTISVEDFQRSYQQREQRLHRYVAAQGNYFEVDYIHV